MMITLIGMIHEDDINFHLLGTTNLRLLYRRHQRAFSLVMIVFRQNKLWRQYCLAWWW